MYIPKKISVILPTYNEKNNIVPLMCAINDELKPYEHEIIVVDDNSSDGTFNIVAESRIPFAKAVLNDKDRSLAKSIRCGLEKTAGDVFIIMDSDFNHQPKYLPFMIEALSYYDCVCASRFLYGGSMEPRAHQILSWFFNIFVRFMTGGQITDSLYGFIAIKREAIEKCDYDDIFWGYGDYCIRLMYYLQKKNTPILQFPAVNGKRLDGKGNSRFFKVFRQYFREVMKLTYKIRIRRCA